MSLANFKYLKTVKLWVSSNYSMSLFSDDQSRGHESYLFAIHKGAGREITEYHDIISIHSVCEWIAL